MHYKSGLRLRSVDIGDFNRPLRSEFTQVDTSSGCNTSSIPPHRPFRKRVHDDNHESKFFSIPCNPIFTTVAIAKQWRLRNKRRQPRLVRSVGNILKWSAPSTNYKHTTGRNVFPSAQSLPKRTNKSRNVADDSKSATIGHGKEYLFPVKRPRKPQTQGFICRHDTAQREASPGYNAECQTRLSQQSVAPLSSEAGLFPDVQRDILPVRCVAEASFTD